MEPNPPPQIDWAFDWASLFFVVLIAVFLHFAPVLRDWAQGSGGSAVVVVAVR